MKEKILWYIRAIFTILFAFITSLLFICITPLYFLIKFFGVIFQIGGNSVFNYTITDVIIEYVLTWGVHLGYLGGQQ